MPNSFKSISYLAALVLVVGCEPSPERVTVDQAWISVPIAGSAMLAGYGVVENGLGQAVTLQSVTSQSFAGVSLHRTVVEAGMARMEPVDSLTLPAGGRVVLHPGGLHLMLIQSERELGLGDTVALQFAFSDGHELNVSFTVRNTPPE